MKVLLVIPAYNEEKVIGSVLSKLPKNLYGLKVDALVINDGSSDQTLKIISKQKVKVISHPINRGLGAALGTGFEYARRKKYDFLVTLDADGQHNPTEIGAILKPIFKKQADFVVGTRIFKKGMPWTRKIITFFASLLTFSVTNVWSSDSQSGFRAFSKKAISLIHIEVDRMEVSSDFFLQAKKNNLKIVEVSIKPIYTKYSLAKGQNVLNSFNIMAKLALHRLVK